MSEIKVTENFYDHGMRMAPFSLEKGIIKGEETLPGASKCQIFFRISNFQNSHIFGGFRILM